MGLRATDLVLTNCGSRPYVLDGYPTLRVLDADHGPLTVVVSHGSSAITPIAGFDQAPRRVTVQPGHRAVAGLLWRNTVTDVQVPAANGAYLDVTPGPGRPDQTFRTAYPVDLGNTGKLAISAWKAG